MQTVSLTWSNIATTGPEIIQLFSCSTQLNTKFILLINVKRPTLVGILTFVAWKIQHFRVWKEEQSVFCGILVFMSGWKSFITSGPGFLMYTWADPEKFLIFGCFFFFFFFFFLCVLFHTQGAEVTRQQLPVEGYVPIFLRKPIATGDLPYGRI